MRTRAIAVVVVAVVALHVLPGFRSTAAAQVMTVEGGGAGLAVAVGPFGQDAGGGYGGVNVAIPGATWLMPYLSGNGFGGVGANGQAGVAFRLARQNWIARPVFRVGGIFAEDGLATVGFGVYVGRRAGGLFTADVGSKHGAAVAVVHIGGYYGFGGE